MYSLFAQKLLAIITTDALQERLANVECKHGASGYTIVRADGGGSDETRA